MNGQTYTEGLGKEPRAAFSTSDVASALIFSFKIPVRFQNAPSGTCPQQQSTLLARPFSRPCVRVKESLGSMATYIGATAPTYRLSSSSQPSPKLSRSSALEIWKINPRHKNKKESRGALSHRCRQRSVGSIREDREGRPAVEDGVRNEIWVCLRRPAEGRRQVEQGRRDGEQGVVNQNAGNGGVVEPERKMDGKSREVPAGVAHSDSCQCLRTASKGVC
jgi:hypothetical protein